MASVQEIQPLKLPPKGLVVDDDPVWQSSFIRYLTDGGFAATKASTLEQAENLLNREFFHVAMVDMSLVGDADRSGLKVLRKIHAMREGTSGMLLTAYGSPEEGAEAIGAGAFHVFDKRKLEYPVVIDTINRGLETARKTLSRYRSGIRLLAGPGIPEDKLVQEHRVLNTLARGVQEVDQLVATLLRGLYPALRPRGYLGPTVEDSQKIVSGTYWSKVLGAPLRLLIGPTPAIQGEIEKFRDQPGTYRDGLLQELLRFERQAAIAGVVFRATSPSFDAFELIPDPWVLPEVEPPRRR
jgi:ActR/RegA family two-component response regulator/transposase